MRILHLINDTSTGGAQTLLESLASHRSEEDELHLCVLLSDDVLTSRLRSVFDSVTHFDCSRTPLALGRAVALLRRATRDLRPDVVHSHLVQSDLVSLLTPQRTSVRVSTVHISALSPSDPQISRLTARLVAVRSHRFGAVTASHESAADFARLIGYRARPVVIDNGVHIPEGVPREPERRFLHLARYAPVKGHEDLLAAFSCFHRSHPDWKLDLAGQGVTWENQALVEQISRFDLNRHVELHGALADPFPLMTTARALVISSRWGETLPMVGLEALSRGLPVVSTSVGGAPSFVLRPDLLAPPASVEALARCLESVASLDDQGYAALEASSRNHARACFDIRDRVARYRQIYEYAVVGRGRDRD